MNGRGIVKKVSELLIAMVLVFGFSGMAHADLTVVGTGTIQGVSGNYQLIYDCGQNITWLDYTAPLNTWQNQANWASNLTVNFRGQNISGWSLPTTFDSTSGFIFSSADPISSQMAYLWYTDLGNTNTHLPGIPGYVPVNTGPFKNMVINIGYWSGTAYAYDPQIAWWFQTLIGLQDTTVKGSPMDGFAVLPGNIATEVNPTPIPAAVYLFGSGLLGLVGLRKKMMK